MRARIPGGDRSQGRRVRKAPQDDRVVLLTREEAEHVGQVLPKRGRDDAARDTRLSRCACEPLAEPNRAGVRAAARVEDDDDPSRVVRRGRPPGRSGQREDADHDDEQPAAATHGVNVTPATNDVKRGGWPAGWHHPPDVGRRALAWALVTPVAAAVLADPVHPAPLIVASQSEALERRARPAPRPATARRTIAAASGAIAATAVPKKVAWEPTRRHVPRPLSPGEFGRR